MIKLGNTSKALFISIVISLVSLHVVGANRYSVASGNWNATSTWSATSGGASGASFPVAGDVVFIEGNRNVTITANAACTSLSIASGSSLTVGGFNLTVSGTTTISGTLTYNNTAGTKTYTGLVTINSGGNWNNTANSPITFRGGIINNGTFNAGTGVQTFSTNNQSVSGTISISSATVTGITLTNNGTLSITTALAGNGGLTQGANDNLSLGGTTTITTLTATASGNTVVYNGAAQTVKGITYQNLNLDGSGTKTLGAATTTNGTLTVNNGVGFALSTFLLTINGDLISDGTVSGTTGGVTIGGTANQNIGGFTTTGTVIMSKTASTATFTGNVNASGLTINGSGGTLNLGAGLTHTFTGTWTRTNGTLDGGSSLLKIAGSVSGTGGSFAANTGTIEWNAAGAQTLAAVAYNNLMLSGGGAKTMPAGTAVTNNLLINGPTASIAAGQNINVGSLTLGGYNKINGTWGSTSSAATYKDNTYFASTTGILTVANDTRSTTPYFSGLTASQSICYGTPTTSLSGNLSAPGPVYPLPGESVTVTINGVSQNTTVSDATGGFTVNFNTALIPADVTPYDITYTYAGNATLLSAPSNTTTTLTVKPASTGGTISGATSPLCLGAGTGTLTLTGNEGSIVQWEHQVNAGGWVNMGNGGSTTFSETPYASGTWQYRVLVQNGTCPGNYSAVQSITVDATTVGGWISGSSAPICEGSVTGVITLNGSTGNIVRWEKRLDGGSWENIANTLTTYSEIPSSAGAWDYRALVKSGSCPSDYPASFAITVNPALTITLGSNPAICRGITSAQLAYTATTGSPTLYSIDFDPTAIAAGLTDVNGWGLAASPISINVPWNIAPGVYNGTLSVATSYPVCTSVGYPISITVTAQPVATFSYSGSPYCQGAANPLPTFSGGGSAGMFSSSAELVFANSSTGEINLAASTAGTYVVTNTIVASGGCGQVEASSNVTITPSVASPIFALGPSSTRSQGSGTQIFSATASNSTGITYSLDAASIAAGLSINAATGLVAFTAGWLGNSTITATAAGCDGPKVSTHTASTIVASTFYSYQSGNWNDPNTWTFDPSGTTGPITSIPGNNDIVVILPDRTVKLSADVTTTSHDITISSGGILDESTYRFTSTLAALRGGGTLQLASAFFPSVTNNTFVTIDGGTTEYMASGAFDLPAAQTIYYHLTINNTGETARQVNDLVINGDLDIKKGTYQINDATATRRQLMVYGNVTVDFGASLTVGTGNTQTGSDTPLSVTDGGTAPFLNYYINETHRVIFQGNLLNNGTVRFTNQTRPKYDAFTNTGAATVFFQGNKNAQVSCYGITDFYNLVIDKGVDQTFKLNVYSSDYSYFRLFGANTAASANSATANPDIKKALWVRNGTLVLQGLTVIPSLSEGTTSAGTSNSHFIIPANGAIELAGSEVIVLSTADHFSEVEKAYNLSGGSNAIYGINTGSGSYSGISILGKLQVTNGYLSTRESAGLLYWSYASGQFILNNGTVDTKQFHNPERGTTGLVTFTQTGGELILRGRFQNTINYPDVESLKSPALNTARAANGTDGTAGIGTISICANASNGYIITGGNMKIYDIPGTTATSYAFLVNCPVSNINVIGGTLEVLPTTGTALANGNYLINSLASVGNLVVNRQSSTSVVRLATNPLNVLKDITLQSGVLEANNLDISIGGNFTIYNGTTYTPGTNSTTFNGSGSQMFTVNLASALNLNILKINKTADDVVILSGSQAVINASDLNLQGGKLDDNGKTINISGNIYNAGIHFSTPGTGKIVLNSTTATQTIDGDGNGQFQNLELNNAVAGTLAVNALNNLDINGTLTFSGTGNKTLNIQTFNLAFGPSSTIIGYDENRYIQTSGNSGDGGITKTYSASAASFVFPVGAPTLAPSAKPAKFTPATITINGTPTTYGTITVVPVGKEHPNTTSTGRSLTYFWRVKSGNGFDLGPATVSHSYNYSTDDVVSIGPDPTEAQYVPARFDRLNNTWTSGTNASINTSTHIMGAPWLSNTGYIDGEYTAGDNNPTNPFGTPKVFFSRINGAAAGSGLWSNSAVWSFTSNTGTANTGGLVPGANDIVIIGANDSVYLATNNTTANIDPRSCASLQIERGSALDIGFNPLCRFGVVTTHPNGNGNFRLTTSWNSGSTYAFPAGDFSDFNINLGTTELYSTNPNAGTTYWLPNGILSYGNLILSPLGGSNIIFPNNNLTIYGNLITRGQNADSWFCPSWDSNYPTAPTTRIAKTITIFGNLDIQGGALIWYGNGTITQNFVVYGDVKVAPNAAIQAYSGATSQNMSIGGNLINNTVGTTAGGTTTVRQCNFSLVPVTFFGNTSATISNTLNSPITVFDRVILNKGNSQATTLTISIGGTLTTLTDNWLTLQNGTLIYNRTGNLNIATGTPLVIPASAGLTINNSPSNITIGTNTTSGTILSLSGKLKLTSNFTGNVYIGTNGTTATSHNDIQYSSAGTSAIEIANGNLYVNGQIRRDPSNASGILSYTQTGGNVTILGNAITASPANTNNAKLEVLNDGSQFTMSGGNLTLVRGAGGNIFGDLYLRPASGSVTGGTITLAPAATGNQTFQIESGLPLNNLTLSGSAGNVATAKLMVSPLVLNGNLVIGTNTVFNTNNINTTFNGNFTNNAGAAGYVAGTNLTTFSASNSSSYLGAQTLTGATNFYNLTISPGASLTLNTSCNVLDDLVLSSGTLILGARLIQVSGNFKNNARFTDNNAANTGIRLMGTTPQHVSGEGNFGRLEINNTSGVLLDNDIYLEEDLALTQGIFDIGEYLLSLGLNSNIQGSSYSATKMIKTDGVFSSQGVRKLFPTGATASFVYPMGTPGKYTPVTLSKSSSGTVGYVQINPVSKRHPSVIDPANALDYYWKVTSSGITGFTGSLVFNYLQSDVKGTLEASYMAARLIVPGTSWSMANTNNATTNLITFNHTGSNNLGGEYTTGTSAAFPPDVPVYTSNKNGNWSDKTIWTQTSGTTYPCPDGGPNGFIVIVNHEVTANSNFCQAYRTTINNKLKIVSPYFGHNLGTVDGSGTLYLEAGSFPAGIYTEFLDCVNNGTIEYGGSGTYTIVADLYNSVPNILVSGTGTRVLPAKDLTICKSLKINGPVLDNSVNNRQLIIQGTMELISGSFNSGTGSTATVSYQGSNLQTIGGSLGNFTGTNAFNNFEINNAAGLSVNTGGAVEVKGNLYLTNGLINTIPDAPWNCGTLNISNTEINCVIPAGGSSVSFVNGPLSKKINQGDDFLYPLGIYISGIGNVAGNRLRLSSSKSGTILWTASYNNPNPTFNSFTAPLEGVSSKEYWNVQALAGSKSVININWNPESDITPLVTQNGLTDITISSYSSGSWQRVNTTAAGDDYNGTASTSALETSAGSNDYTLASLSLLRPKAKLDPTGPTCGDAGIPVSFVSPTSIPFSYELNYSVDNVAQPPVTISALPYTLPTPIPGVYKLTSFTYNNGAGNGVVDASTVTVNAIPTTADAGPDQALCGITSATLNANPLGITTGTGVWSIVSGKGGTLISPTSRTSQFIGLNGTSYKLRWTISNGSCTSADDVLINFTLLPLAPSALATQTLCESLTISDIQVTPPPGSTVTWFTTPTGGTVLPNSQLVTSGEYYAESNAGTGCLSLTRTKVTVTVIQQVWTGAISTDWNVPGNWSCGSIPNLNSNIQIPNVANKPVLSTGATGAVKNINISSNSSLTVTNNTLQIAGSITNSGTFTATGGTIEMKGTSAQVLGTNVFNGNIIKGLTINNAAGVTLQGLLSVTGVVNAVSGNLASGGNLTLASTAAQTALVDGTGTGSITGNVTMQRYLPSGFGYKYLSSPFQSATVNEFADDVDLAATFPTFYAYDEDNHRDSAGVSIYSSGWVKYVTTANPLVPVNGYAANMGANAAAKTINATGVVNSGNLTRTLYNHNRVYTKGFNLAGNPYPSPINWNAASGWTKTNIDNALYYFDASTTDQYTGTYSTYINGISSNGIANGIIPSMQGFFIHVSNGSYPVTATLAMDNRVRINNLTPVFHKSETAQELPLVRLSAAYENKNVIDPVVVYFDANASQGFDQMLDALKLMNTDLNVPNLYAVTPQTDLLSISALPLPADSITRVPLGIKTEKAGWVILSAANLDNIPSGLNVYLADDATGRVLNLQQIPTYRVNISPGSVNNRFALLFSEKEINGIINESNVFYANIENGKLKVYVNLPFANESRLTILNVLGQVMQQQTLYGNGQHDIDTRLTGGIYILSLQSQQGINSIKIYIPK